MKSSLYWEEVAEIIINELVKVKSREPLLIVTNTNGDLNLAQKCLSAGLRSGIEAKLIIKKRSVQGSSNNVGSILSEAIKASNVILDLSDELTRDPAFLEARKEGTSLLATDVEGIEDYVVRALLDVDYELMIDNAKKVAKLWNQTEDCQVKSPQGTDLSFELMPRKSIIADGALSKNGEVDFFPGAQVSIAPIEGTINGTIMVDASDSVQGVIHRPYSLTIENGVITAVEGGKEADIMREWLKNRNDEKIYRLCHFSIGLNPEASISGNFVEDERLLGGVDFGFGYQNPDFGGEVGISPYHMDIMLSTPTIYLDGEEMSKEGELNYEIGFERT